MTDVAATPTGGIDKTAVLDSGQALVWQPAAPAKPRRTALWIGIGVGALLVLGAAGALSTVLIAPAPRSRASPWAG
ncbi:hypothetical protein [Microbacterium sp. NIBRBAC000506063]|uniref:hypothetical protein n=1 Tax=Microbacterium sp. NIBRBAC000506063 TaxID=2734618 RepID=UPI001BB78DBB|nr:hypothetical protein [Microbacterium sp. NIBRBAC000506063]QTV79338.1 hypothetical protein KAE78_10100 [Microbacterium sp. NIBRBAC000506063]